ncbi:MAG: hypothetical protein N2Z59_01130 [Alteraurantiacibacter sp.]|nr:hypothetical protein [Alteraurantiacibacter sp.]
MIIVEKGQSDPPNGASCGYPRKAANHIAKITVVAGVQVMPILPKPCWGWTAAICKGWVWLVRMAFFWLTFRQQRLAVLRRFHKPGRAVGVRDFPGLQERIGLKRKAVRFYRTPPVPWAGFDALPYDIDMPRRPAAPSSTSAP